MISMQIPKAVCATQLLFLSPVRQLILLLLTCRIGFAAVDSATQLKIIERGVPKEELAFFAPFLMPFGIICPILVLDLVAALLLELVTCHSTSLLKR